MLYCERILTLKRLFRAGLLTTLAAASLLADVTYTKTVRYTGGSMLGFLRNLVGNPFIQRMVGADLESALDDQEYTVYVKGSKMAQVAEGGSTIYDLDANSVTSIDDEKHKYSVQTFAELRAQIERAEEWMKHPKGEAPRFDVRVEKTNHTRALDGRTARETLITLTAESESAWGKPVVNVTSWLVPVDLTTRPLYDFSRRAASKLSSVFTVVPSFFGAAGGAQELNGISALDEIAVTGVSNPLTNLFRSRDTRSNAPVITLEIQSSRFSARPLDSSHFTIPAGYRQEQQHRQ